MIEAHYFPLRGLSSPDFGESKLQEDMLWNNGKDCAIVSEDIVQSYFGKDSVLYKQEQSNSTNEDSERDSRANCIVYGLKRDVCVCVCSANVRYHADYVRPGGDKLRP